jgi:hypothetical protein
MTSTIEGYFTDREGFITALAVDIFSSTIRILDAARTGNPPIQFDDAIVLSEAQVHQVAMYAARDMARSHVEQGGALSISKYVAYIVYWFGRLRPIRAVYCMAAGASEAQEIVDINERVSLALIERLVLSIIVSDPSLAPSHWISCKSKPCAEQAKGRSNMGRCFFDSFRLFLSYNNLQHANHLVYSQVYRLASSHLFVAIIDQALFYSCPECIRAAQEP